MKKNIKGVAKLKDCEKVGLWQRSIVKYIYWSAVSTENGDGEVIYKVQPYSLGSHFPTFATQASVL